MQPYRENWYLQVLHNTVALNSYIRLYMLSKNFFLATDSALTIHGQTVYQYRALSCSVKLTSRWYNWCIPYLQDFPVDHAVPGVPVHLVNPNKAIGYE